MKDSSPVNAGILQEQIEILFRNAPTTYTITLFNCLVVFFVLRDHIEADYIFFWFCSLAFLIVMRIFTISIYWRRTGELRRSQYYFYLYILLMHCSAMVWSLLVYLPLTSEIVWMHAFISFVIAGMSAGAMVTLSASLMASIPYLILILVPFCYYFMAFNTPPHQGMSIMAGLYLLLLIRLAFQINRNTKSAITTRFENEELYQFLKKASRDVFVEFLEKSKQNTHR